MQPQDVYSKWWLPINISTYGGEVDWLINVMHMVMGALFLGWGIFFVYCLFRFRQRPGQKARYEEVSGSLSKTVEVSVLVIEIVLLVFFSMPVWAKVKNEFPKESESTQVHIVGQQFEWIFHYPGKDGKWGKINPKLIDDADNPLGLDRQNDPDAKDDIVSRKVFYFPVDKPVIAQVTSKDVIHSFKVPVLRFTQDVIPGVKIPIWFEANKTGRYAIACAQLCGVLHTTMSATAVITTQKEFDEWLKKEGEKQSKQ